MKILFDLDHPAHLNFFKNTIYYLLSKNERVIVTYLDRGKLPKIVEKELVGIKKYKIGKHTGSKLSIIFQANILKFILNIPLFIKEKPDICLSIGSYTNGLACRLFRIPNIQFCDDPERKNILALQKLTATELYFPPIIKPTKKIKNMNALKEWAYLSPRYFKPNPDKLKEYGLKERGYIFIREVSNGTLNYSKQKACTIADFADQLPIKYKVLFSLEDKAYRGQYPEDWIELKEPVNDIHSLIYYSKYLISSGDSMAREGSLLGIPSIYCGFREMKANKLLENKGLLHKVTPNNVPDFINSLDTGTCPYPEQNLLRKNLELEWTDISELIINRINYYRDK